MSPWWALWSRHDDDDDSTTTTAADAPRAAAIRSGAAQPTRAERQQCWAARDALFACLDAAALTDPARPAAAAACPAQTAALARLCPAAWVVHFQQWRVADAQRRARLDELRRRGATPLDLQPSFAEHPSASASPSPPAAAQRMQDIQQRLDKKKAG